MSGYLVLARKWRPKNFEQLVGQEHVVRALSNGLKSGRLHHAFLFTGTRGVGKTTIARIIAKALNCETGITANPCGVCHSCTEIDQGRYPDLMEIDAASRTKVDDTRELLDNVIYAPSKGRFKVYLIDEVHMLSTHSFNALLKTLEEPPEHVKFVLATTDPQKLPVTVLSRCLKFHLRRLSQSEISQQMQMILGAEGIPFDAAAVDELARAADGSMRDGLSLLDQAIGYGAGTVQTDGTRQMLGTTARDLLSDLLLAIAAQDTVACEQHLARVIEHNPNYLTVAAQLMELLHDAALVQRFGEQTRLLELARGSQALAAAADPARLQLLYQMALTSARDLQWAPDARIAFEMAVLRMLAFSPDALASGPSAAQRPNQGSSPPASGPGEQGGPGGGPRPSPVSSPQGTRPQEAPRTTAEAASGSNPAAMAMRQLSEALKTRGSGQASGQAPGHASGTTTAPLHEVSALGAAIDPKQDVSDSAAIAHGSTDERESAVPASAATRVSEPAALPAEPFSSERATPSAVSRSNAGAPAPTPTTRTPAADHADWNAFFELADCLQLSGPSAEILQQAGLLVCQQLLLRLRVAASQAFLLSERSRNELRERIEQVRPGMQLEIEIGGEVVDSLAVRRAERLRERRAAVRTSIELDPSVKVLQRDYGAVVVEDSIELLGS